MTIAVDLERKATKKKTKKKKKKTSAYSRFYWSLYCINQYKRGDSNGYCLNQNDINISNNDNS